MQILNQPVAIVILRTQALYAGSRWILATMLISYTATLVFGGVRFTSRNAALAHFAKIATAVATQSPKWLGWYGCVTSFPRQEYVQNASSRAY